MSSCHGNCSQGRKCTCSTSDPWSWITEERATVFFFWLTVGWIAVGASLYFSYFN